MGLQEISQYIDFDIADPHCKFFSLCAQINCKLLSACALIIMQTQSTVHKYWYFYKEWQMGEIKGKTWKRVRKHNVPLVTGLIVCKHVNHMLLPLNWLDLKSIEHLWEFFDWCVGQDSAAPLSSSKHQMRECLGGPSLQSGFRDLQNQYKDSW